MVKSEQEDLRFGVAVGELEEILRRIENEEIDIDELAAELKKASRLLELCRSKIRKAEVEVTQIVQALDSEDEKPDDEAQPLESDGVS